MLRSSYNRRFRVSRYESITKEVFVTVKAPSPSAPDLSTDVANISNGNIKFAAADSTLEYSLVNQIMRAMQTCSRQVLK